VGVPQHLHIFPREILATKAELKGKCTGKVNGIFYLNVTGRQRKTRSKKVAVKGKRETEGAVGQRGNW
jgi:hypothetical protein